MCVCLSSGCVASWRREGSGVLNATVLGAGHQLNLVDNQEVICNDLKLENGAVDRILELFLEQSAFVTT